MGRSVLAMQQMHVHLRSCHNCDACALQGCFRYWKPNLELVKQEVGHREGIEAITFAPSDLKFATASKDSTVKARDPPCTSGLLTIFMLHLCAGC